MMLIPYCIMYVCIILYFYYVLLFHARIPFLHTQNSMPILGMF